MFTVTVLGARMETLRRVVCDSEAEALELARSIDLSQCLHVSIDVGGAESFAMRYLSADRGDSGWRVWVDGRFVGGAEILPVEVFA